MAGSNSNNFYDDDDDDEDEKFDYGSVPNWGPSAVSNNFPVQPDPLNKAKKSLNLHRAVGSNNWSVRDLGLDNIGSNNNNGRFGRYNTRKFKHKSSEQSQEYQQPSLQTKGTERGLQLQLIGIGYDSQFGFDDEVELIKETQFEARRTLLTFDDFEKLLIDSPTMVHVSTHGSHQYKTIKQETEFQVTFEEPQTFKYLIDDHPKYSAYYAVIAVLFEMEINHFVQYGLKKQQKKHRQHITTKKTWIWKGGVYALLDNKLLYKMLITIIERFGCFYRENINAKCIEIWWGKYKYIDGQLQFDQVPHPPVQSYQLSTLYRDDENVQEILKEIEKDYNKTVRNNIKIAESLKKHQLFSWEILLILLNRELLEHCAHPDDTDNTEWLSPPQTNDNNNDTEVISLMDDNNHDDDHSDIDDDEYAAFFGSSDDEDDDKNNNDEKKGDDEDWNQGDSLFEDDGTRQTLVKFGKNQELSRELKIIPTNIDKNNRNNANEMEKIIENLKTFKDRLMRSLKKSPDIQILLDFASTAACNIHIIRFRNEAALKMAKKKIDKIRQNPKYNDDYDILFRCLNKADESTKHLVGYIKPTQGKPYNIDIKDSRDPISRMLKKHLISPQECKIKLLVLNGCHSFILGKIFSQFVENVICIHPYVKIWDHTAIIFTKHFYSALQDYTNSRTEFKLSVLKAYMDAKINVTKQCSNDKACVSHSHIFNQHNQHYYHQSHFNEDWKQLQSIMNDSKQFEQYHKKYANHCNHDHNNYDIHDGTHLIISNLHNENQMKNLINYLQDYDSNIIYHKFHSDLHYNELSYAYLKFESDQHRIDAMKILEQKKYDEEIIFSNKLIFDFDIDGDEKEEKKEEKEAHKEEEHDDDNLGWNHRKVPRCCCAPHHPHLAQDKLILIQDNKIINRTIIRSISTIKSGLNDIRIRNEEIRERKMQRELNRIAILEGRDSSILSSRSDSIKNDKHVLGDQDSKNNDSDHSDDDDNNDSDDAESKNNDNDNNNINNIQSLGRPNLNQNSFSNGDNYGKKRTSKQEFNNNFGSIKQSKKPKVNNFGGSNNFNSSQDNKPKQTKPNVFVSNNFKTSKPEKKKKKNNFGGGGQRNNVKSNNFGGNNFGGNNMKSQNNKKNKNKTRNKFKNNF